MSATVLAEAPAPSGRAPALRRRLLCMVYEGVLLFGVVFIAAYLFSTLTQQRDGLTHHLWLTAWLGLVVGVYFVGFWTHGGQTLPMKTWRLRLVDAQLQPVSTPRAIARYVLSWLWWLPPLALHPLAGLSLPFTLALLAAWVAVWAAASLLDPARQFVHDRLAGTRLIAAAARR
ncbi:MAG: RDD family protein [Pararobbsia sp.]